MHEKPVDAAVRADNVRNAWIPAGDNCQDDTPANRAKRKCSRSRIGNVGRVVLQGTGLTGIDREADKVNRDRRRARRIAP
jgi:hypothetical protein